MQTTHAPAPQCESQYWSRHQRLGQQKRFSVLRLLGVVQHPVKPEVATPRFGWHAIVQKSLRGVKASPLE